MVLSSQFKSQSSSQPCRNPQTKQFPSKAESYAKPDAQNHQTCAKATPQSKNRLSLSSFQKLASDHDNQPVKNQESETATPRKETGSLDITMEQNVKGKFSDVTQLSSVANSASAKQGDAQSEGKFKPTFNTGKIRPVFKSKAASVNSSEPKTVPTFNKPFSQPVKQVQQDKLAGTLNKPTFKPLPKPPCTSQAPVVSKQGSFSEVSTPTLFKKAPSFTKTVPSLKAPSANLAAKLKASSKKPSQHLSVSDSGYESLAASSPRTPVVATPATPASIKRKLQVIQLIHLVIYCIYRLFVGALEVIVM